MNSIRTHGLGVVNTTVNYTYQFLKEGNLNNKDLKGGEEVLVWKEGKGGGGGRKG